MDRKWIVNLSGKDYPTWPGVLDEAHERGLASIDTELVQIPSADNDYTAIVKATVTMKDGSTFSDYGDASPKNVKERMVPSIIRFASTRAKGRALRDAINCGECLAEELPDEQPESRPTSSGRGMDGDRAARPVTTPEGEVVCAVCRKGMKPSHITWAEQNKVSPPAHAGCLRPV